MPQTNNNIAFLAPYRRVNKFNKGKFINENYDEKQKIGWGLQMHLIPDLWSITKGEHIKVAVLDTGVFPHIDLGSDIVHANFTDEEEIRDGHGTLVAGIIGARDNEFGIVGVAPKCKIYSAKVLKNNGNDTIEPIIEGLKWAIEEIKVDIISMSLHTVHYSKKIHDLIKKANDENRFVICAAGNKGSHLKAINYPAKHEETVAVGSIGLNSNIAYTSSQGSELDVVAPGVEVCSTDLNDEYAVVQGTSFATPFVSGIVALMLAKHRKFNSKSELTNIYQLREHLRKTSTDIGSNGFDNKYGFGLINPSALICGRNLKD